MEGRCRRWDRDGRSSGRFCPLSDRTQKKEKAAYLALRLAVLLEGYASKCCDFYFDNLNAVEPPDEPYPAWRTDLPEMPELPDDTEAWRAMDKKLLANVWSFPIEFVPARTPLRLAPNSRWLILALL